MRKSKPFLIAILTLILWANGFIGPVLSAYAGQGEANGMFICTSFGLQPVDSDGNVPVVDHCKHCILHDKDAGGSKSALTVQEVLTPKPAQLSYLSWQEKIQYNLLDQFLITSSPRAPPLIHNVSKS